MTVIDGATDSVIATVATGFHPGVLCYNPQNNKVYCANTDSTTTVIDGATNQVITTISVGDVPLAFCYNPQNNKVYLASQGADSGLVTVIDGATDTVIATVTTGGWPSALCYNPENNKVYCANAGSNSVTIIHGQTNQVLRTIGVGDAPNDLAWNPVQNRTYVANYSGSGGSISVLRDSAGGTGVEEGPKPRAASSRPAATIVRGVLRLPVSPFTTHTSLFDMTGRQVMTLRPGPNDVSRLAPGVYFVRHEPTAVSKVVIQR